MSILRICNLYFPIRVHPSGAMEYLCYSHNVWWWTRSFKEASYRTTLADALVVAKSFLDQTTEVINL